MGKRFIIFWAYLKEIILSFILYGLLFIFWTPKEISFFFINSSDKWASKITTLFFGASLAFFWNFFSRSDTQFAKWLYWKKSYNTYVKAFITSIVIFLLITICLILASISKNYYIGHISGWLLILGLINIFTFLRNITDLMRLNILFNIKVDEENRNEENK